MLARERALQVALAEAAKHVHEEGGDNTGPRVRQYQAASSLGGTGWAWCDAFCDFCFDEAGRPLTELHRSAGVELSYDLAKQLGWVVPSPAAGDLVGFQWDSGDLDHIGIVVEPQGDGTIKTVEGNTSPMPGTGQAQGEGDGVYVKTRPRNVCAAFIRVPGNVIRPVIEQFRPGNSAACVRQIVGIRLSLQIEGHADKPEPVPQRFGEPLRQVRV